MQEHPVYDPDTKTYWDYWEGVEQKMIEGTWGHDYDKKRDLGGYRYMPNTLFTATNLAKVEVTRDNKEMWVLPYLRDFDWYSHYDWEIAKGFSGMENDTKRSCFYPLYKLQANKELSPVEELMLEYYKEHLVDKYGKWKTYVHPHQYLYSTFREPLGLPLYHNEAQDFMFFTSRGIGKSFFMMNGPALQNWLSYGYSRYCDEYKYNPNGGTMIMTSALSDYSTTTLAKFQYQVDTHLLELGSYRHKDGRYTPGFFYSNTTGNLDPNDAAPLKQEFEAKTGKNSRHWEYVSTGMELYHRIATKGNAEKVVGKRAGIIMVEEIGVMDNVLEVKAATDPVQIRDNWKYGTTALTGTGGNFIKVKGSSVLFNNPRAHRIVTHQNIFEPGVREIATFGPAYYAEQRFRDENGNLEYEKAFKQVMFNREDKKRTDPKSYDTWVQSYPVVPSEMFRTSGGSKWPVDLFSKRRLQLIADDNWKKVYIPVEFSRGADEKVVTASRKSLIESSPIIDYTLEAGTSKRGVPVIFEPPPPDLYTKPRGDHAVITYDTVKKDEDGSSLVAIGAWKGFAPDILPGGIQDGLIGEFIGRRTNTENHEIAIALALYYNCRILFEDNMTDFFMYCKLKGLLWLLEPVLDKVTGVSKYTPSGKLNYGVTMNEQMRVVADQYLIEYYIEKRHTIDRETGEIKTAVDYLCSLRACDEHINYIEGGNYDWISQARLFALWRQQKLLERKARQQQEGKSEAKRTIADVIEEQSLVPLDVRIKLFNLQQQRHDIRSRHQRVLEVSGAEGEGRQYGTVLSEFSEDVESIFWDEHLDD